MNLVEWLKLMVGARRAEEVVDPNLEAKPSTRSLKRALLVALRCVDHDAENRPKMSQVVRMLEADEYPFREVSNYQSSSSYINFCCFILFYLFTMRLLSYMWSRYNHLWNSCLIIRCGREHDLR